MPRGRPRRSWPQRLVIAFNILLVIVCLGSATGLLWFQREVSAVPRLSISGVLDQEQESGQPQNILMVGIDNGSGLPADDPTLYGRSATLNTDTIMILRVDPSTGRAAILSFPRDLWVPIGGPGGSKGKINSALANGGPEKLIQTIQGNFGIPIHHFVMVNFAGFKQLVSAIDGVPMYFPWGARDRHTGFIQEDPGCVTLDADQALNFARSRYFEIYDEKKGRWVDDLSSDTGRINRQQRFIRAALKRAVAKGVRNPFTLNELIQVGQRSVTLDDQLTTQDLIDLGNQFRDFDPDQLDLYVVPSVSGYAGDAAIETLIDRQAQPIFDIFRGVSDSEDIIPTIRVEVRNGSGSSGQGRAVLKDLQSRGFVGVRSSDARDFRFSTTVIRYAPGEEIAAANVARFVDGTPTFEVDDSLDDVSVVLITGADFTSVRAEPRPIEDFQSFLSTTTTTTIPSGSSEGSTSTTDLSQGYVPEAPDGVSCG